MIKDSDIPFKPKVSEKTMKMAADWLKGNRDLFHGVANYAVFGNGEPIASRFAAPCHGGVVRLPRAAAEPDCVATSISWNNNESRVTKEEIEPFLRWFLYDSYCSRFILNKDDFEFCRDYGIIVSSDIYTPLLQNILITSRHFYEVNKRAFVMFNKLVSEGFSGDWAYVCCFLSAYSAGLGVFHEERAVLSKGGHRAFYLFSTENLKNFCNQQMVVDKSLLTDKNLHFRNYRNYYGGTILFGPTPTSVNDFFVSELLASNKEFREALSNYRKEKNSGEMYAPPNPFTTLNQTFTKPKGSQVSYSELFEFCLPYIKENNLV
jgi:hypothetical protein